MELQRIQSTTDRFYEEAVALYRDAFPDIERRDDKDSIAALAQSDYHLCALCESGAFVGIAAYWENGEFLYLEHFAVLPALRGQGIGSRTLAVLKSLGKTIVLEIEPPASSDFAARRLGFYRREGLTYNDRIEHVQLHYRADDDDCILHIMSYPCALTAEDYSRFRHYLDTCVTHRLPDNTRVPR